MMFGRRVRHLGPIESLITTTTTTTAAAAATTTTTPTTSALLNESRQLLLKQQLKLQLNINVSEMMDNLRRTMNDDVKNNDDNDDKNKFTQKFDGDLRQNILYVREAKDEETETAAKDGQNKLDTVTTVPQLQQKFNKFNIIDAAATSAAATNITATTTSSLRVAEIITATTTLSSSSTTHTRTVAAAAATTTTSYKSLTQKQSENTALAKFNRIIDNTVPVISHYQHQQPQQQQQTFNKTSQPTSSSLDMPLLSDSLKRRLASHPYYQTDLIVNNSKIISSPDRTRTATTTATVLGEQPLPSQLPLISSHQPKREVEQEQVVVGVEVDQLKRNDVHYLLKQLNSFSDIEEIEIVDMKQKQRLHQQLIRETQKQQHQQQHQQHYHYQQQQQQQQQLYEDQQNLQKITDSAIFSYDSQSQTRQQQLPPLHGQIDSNQISHQLADVSHLSQHVTTTTLPMYVSSYSQHISDVTEQHVASSSDPLRQFVHLPPPLYKDSVQQQKADTHDDNDADDGACAKESKQHFQATSSASSPTATSLVIYSPSSQSHKGIRRYASLHHQDDAQHHMQQHQYTHCRYHTQHHHHHRHQQAPPCHGHSTQHYAHHSHMPHEHYSEGSILDSAAARAAACDPLALQQFVDDYIFQSCHYLETNNFAANYCTAMVESSSHEFRPSTTTTTRTSNEEYDDEEYYVEDHSSAHSFELHECEPPTVICKAPAPSPLLKEQQAPQHIRASMRHLAPLSSPPPQYTMETRLCSSGVQTDLTASSLAQSFSLSSSLSSSEQRKRRQPIFKCCYTPLDRWREKRHNQQQKQQQQEEQQQQQQQLQLQLTKKRTKTVTTQREQQSSFSPSSSSPYRTTTTTSCLKNTTVAVVGASASAYGAHDVNIIAPLDGAGGAGGGGAVHSMGIGGLMTTTNSFTTAAAGSSTSASLVVHSQHHSLSTKNAPYAV